MKYDRVSTIDEVQDMTIEELEMLKPKLRRAPLQIDEYTFQPYKVVDGVRYDINPVIDGRHGINEH